MFRLGEKQILQVEKKVPMGVFLIEPVSEESQVGNSTDEAQAGGQASQATPVSPRYVRPLEAQEQPRYSSRYGRNGYARESYGRDGARRYVNHPDNMPVHVLLPGSQVPEGTEPGDQLNVFLYRDSEDRLIATRKEPKLTLHQVGFLTVKEVGRIGAFMDWGLDKDLLLPFHEQPRDRVQKGQECLVAVYIDKSGRLCATMNVYPYLRTDSPYHAGDEVDGTAYQTSEHFGTFVAVDNIFSALIPRKELMEDIPVGASVHARVVGVKPDGKLDLSMRDKSYRQMETDARILLSIMQDNNGVLPYSDASDADQIKEELHMSRNEFKRALGHLLKEGSVEIQDDVVTLRQ